MYLHYKQLVEKELLDFVLLELLLFQCTLYHGTFHLDQIFGKIICGLKMPLMLSGRYFIFLV